MSAWACSNCVMRDALVNLAFRVSGLGLAVFLTINSAVAIEPATRPTAASPKLRIEQVKVPKDASEPVTIRFVLTAEGQGPMAISREQFKLSISSSGKPVETCSMGFAKDAPKTFTVTPESPVTITVTSWTARSLRPGKYMLRINVNSSKTRQFDYQWLGATHSEEHALQIN